MPNKIVQQVLGCLGLDNRQQMRSTTPHPTARPAYVAPPSRPNYQPGQHYSIAELDQFATSNLPSQANRAQFQSQLRDTLLLAETSRSNKALLCKHLATLMTDDDQLECHGAPRQANYFASYCVDLSLQELEQQYAAAIETDLRNVLQRWVTTLCPAQLEFNLNGVVYTRTEVLDMLQAPDLINRQIRQASSALAQQLERCLRGEGTSSKFQTVHDRSVQSNGSRVLDIMKTKHGQTQELSDKDVKVFVTSAVKTNSSRTIILAGMNQCLSNTNRDNNWAVNISPQRAIKEVIQYIQSVQDQVMRTNLTSALLERLREINVEDPCVSGVLQRLIDVPNGIDPDMNFAGASRQIGEEMATLAGKTHAHFSNLMEEGMQAIEEEKHNPDVTKTIVRKIGQDMFHTRVDQDMKLIGGLSEAELAPHRERLKAGFD